MFLCRVEPQLVTFCFAISSFVVADTANAGFNVVLTGLLYMAYCGGTYYVINKSHTPLAVSLLAVFFVRLPALFCLTDFGGFLGFAFRRGNRLGS